ncbi:MAG: protein translocase subunit SecF [Gammaproteobacteria bacterium]|mgnify:CR=1 FL=1|nr:protein translocase subunit SecF [Gammaproteobacteria bacterium]|tara:strand:+ start:221552 stop:222436 length:885 start_codon:yes stop_codon:yes gene_type:complete
MFSLVKKNINFDFLGLRTPALIISSIFLLVSIVSFSTKGLNWGIDFSSGYVIQLKFNQNINISEIRNSFQKNGLNDSIIQYYGTNKEVIIKIKDDKDFKKTTINDFLNQSIKGEFKIMKLEFVGSQIGSELREKGEWAMLVALLSILVYIGFRFEFLYGIGAIMALIHDVIITLGVFSIIQLQFDLSVLAAVLAVIGYSLNDTIVVFDRIRENTRTVKKNSFIDILNISINQTLSRTIITSLTTSFVLISLLVFGGLAVKYFAIAMLIGIFIGTYSSIFIASTSLHLLGIEQEK